MAVDVFTPAVPAFSGVAGIRRMAAFAPGASLGGAVTTYRMRAYDSGRATYVYWTNTTTPVLAPSAGDTTPNFTGSLTNPSIIGTG